MNLRSHPPHPNLKGEIGQLLLIERTLNGPETWKSTYSNDESLSVESVIRSRRWVGMYVSTTSEKTLKNE